MEWMCLSVHILLMWPRCLDVCGAFHHFTLGPFNRIWLHFESAWINYSLSLFEINNDACSNGNTTTRTASRCCNDICMYVHSRKGNLVQMQNLTRYEELSTRVWIKYAQTYVREQQWSHVPRCLVRCERSSRCRIYNVDDVNCDTLVLSTPPRVAVFLSQNFAKWWVTIGTCNDVIVGRVTRINWVPIIVVEERESDFREYKRVLNSPLSGYGLSWVGRK